MQFSGEPTCGGVRGRVCATVMLLTLSVVSGCKRESGAGETAPAPSSGVQSRVIASEAAAGNAPVPAGVASAAAPAQQASETPPASFSSGEKVEIANAVGLGCEARTSQGWLELLCRKKNGTGGHPVRAIRDLAAFEAEPAAPAEAAPAEAAPAEAAPAEAAPAEAAPAASETPSALQNVVQTDEQGQLRVPVPWRAGHATKLRLEWSDTAYDLEIDGLSARLVLPVSVALRRQCEKLRTQSQALVDAAKQNTDALNPADVAKLPRFGLCQTAGLGAWALELKALEATGAAAARVVRATLAVTHVDPEGQLTGAAFGTLAFAPQGLQAKPLMAYDYDADGQQELIVRYELMKAPAGAARLPAVYSYREGKVLPYDKLEPMGPGAVAVEQLDYDMRPDLADYGPYIAWLAPGCGVAACPDRITGPLFFAHSEKDGAFSRTHAAALGALKRACPKAPDPVVVTQGEGINVARTAQQLGCAKAWKVDDATLNAALETHRAKLCAGAEDCALYATFKAWVSSAPPATL